MLKALLLVLVLLIPSTIAISSSNNEILCSEAVNIRDAAKKQAVLQAERIKEQMASKDGMSFEEFVIRSTIIESLKELAWEMNKLVDTDCSEA